MDAEAIPVWMISPTPGRNARGQSTLPPEQFDSSWYAVYTFANHEKRVCEQLEQRHVRSFLPVYETVRRWKDRRVRLRRPLFPGYLFVRIILADRLRVLQVPGVVRLVGFNGQPSAVRDEEIQAIRKGLAYGARVEPHPFLSVGQRVRVKAGPLEGFEGIVIRRRNRLRLVISLGLIQRAAAVDIEAADLEKVQT